MSKHPWGLKRMTHLTFSKLIYLQLTETPGTEQSVGHPTRTHETEIKINKRTKDTHEKHLFFCLLAWTSVLHALLHCLAACRFLASASSSAFALLAAAGLEDGWQSNSLLLSPSFRVACFLRALSLVPADMMLWHILWSTGPCFRSSLLNISTAVCLWCVSQFGWHFEWKCSCCHFSSRWFQT